MVTYRYGRRFPQASAQLQFGFMMTSDYPKATKALWATSKPIFEVPRFCALDG
jgi:hypothetical protein